MEIKLFKVESADSGSVYTIRMDSSDPRFVFRYYCETVCHSYEDVCLSERRGEIMFVLAMTLTMTVIMLLYKLFFQTFL